MDAHLLLAILLIGAGVGFLSGAFGKGGSAVSTPLLHALGVPAMAAIASPLPATIPSTLLAGHRYARKGHVDRRIVRFGLGSGIPATVVGALLTQWIPGGGLILATDVLLLALALRMITKSHDESNADEDRECIAPARTIVAVVAGVGFVSGLFGNSGGFLLAPLFITLLGMPMRRALGTSLALAAALAVPGTIVHAWLGHIDWSVTLAFGLAAIPLASVGARTALRMRERHLTSAYAFGIATLAAGLLVFAH